MAGLRAEELWKRYGRVDAVRGVSFTAAEAELLAILGPSGCGKTSTLRMIAGLERIDGGQLFIGDALANGLSPAQRNVAMAFENYGLYPRWSTFDNIAYPLRLRHVDPRAIGEKVASVAKALQLNDVLERLPEELSGGYRQRIGLARALVRDPSVFLLDEPLSHVDADMRNDLREELKRLHVQSGATMVLVSHDQLDALSMADSVIVMNDGEVQQIGPPMELYDRPVNAFTAGFIGEPPMNLLEASVEVLPSGETLGRLECRGEQLVAELPPGALSSEVRVPRSAVVGFRAHSVSLWEGAQCCVCFECVVNVVEPLGDAVLLSVSLGRWPVRMELPPGVAGDVITGSRMRLYVNVKDLHLFDVASGRRLTWIKE